MWDQSLVRYLIDGNNLLHAVHALGAGPAVGRQGLCTLVTAWALRTGASVTLYFDGPMPRGGLAAQLQPKGIEVRFSGKATADSLIEQEVAAAALPAEITVVTSDRAIQHEVRYRKAKTTASDHFAEQLYHREERTTRTERQTVEKPDEPDPDDVETWMKRVEDDLGDLPDDW
ncbi:MAG: NYN domain-containing protein [Phycisphaerae bacterium]